MSEVNAVSIRASGESWMLKHICGWRPMKNLNERMRFPSKEDFVCLLDVFANFEVSLFHLIEFLRGGVEIICRICEGGREQRLRELGPLGVEAKASIVEPV